MRFNYVNYYVSKKFNIRYPKQAKQQGGDFSAGNQTNRKDNPDKTCF